MLKTYGFDNPDIVKILSFTAGSGDGQEQLEATIIKSKARDGANFVKSLMEQLGSNAVQEKLK